jgi:hypothetical protein
MAQVKGKFITLAGSLMTLYPEALKFCDNILVSKTGKHWNELDQEGWYDTTVFDGFMKNYAKASPSGENAIVNLGKQVYPTIKKSGGIPGEMKTPLDLIIFEAEGFKLNHQGADVKPRYFSKKENKHIIVQAPAPGYSQKLYEGVYLGILQMYGINTGKVVMTKGAPVFEYEITW